MRQRQINSSTHAVTRYASLSQFTNSSEIPAGLLSIKVNDLPIDMLHVAKGSDTTLVFLHGAIEPHFKIPVLTGQGISNGLTANRIFISDPALALSEKLLLSWFAGNHSHPDGQLVIVQLVRKILESAGAKRVIFFGGSGGGFASLYFASFFDKSLAVAYNPQTDISKYNAKAIHEFTRYAHNIHVREYDPVSFLPETTVTDVCRVYAEEQSATVAYFQNLNDHTHVNRQLRPFLDQLHPANNVHLLAQPWGAGHTAPPKELLRKVLKDLSESPDWGVTLNDNGFQKVDHAMASDYAQNGVPGTFVSPDIHARSRFPKYDKL